MELDIKFFKNDREGSTRLGGGYITSGGLKTNFSVFKSAKSSYGFNIALPYRKNDTDGSIVNEVSFTTKAVSDQVHKYIQDKLNGGSSASDEQPRVVKTAEVKTSGPATSVDIKDKVKKFGGRPPF